jgi:hypothetical protein
MDIREYSKNAKIHPKKQIEQIAESIKAFGCKQPIVIDKNGEIVVGHGRFLAMRMLGWTEVKEANSSKKGEEYIPYILADDLNDDEIRAYRLADNKLNESEWDLDLVKVELEGLSEGLQNITGFDIADLFSDGLSKKFSPVVGKVEYEPKETNHEIGDLYTKRNDLLRLLEKIKNEELRDMIEQRISYFTEFNYSKIADYYAYQAKPEEQEIFEVLGLVLLDKDSLIANGFSKLISALNEDEEHIEE